MLTLTRRPGEELLIGDNVRIIFQRVEGNRCVVSIEAPRDVRVLRGELRPHDDRKETAHETAPG